MKSSLMSDYFDTRYPCITDLEKKAKSRMPAFAYDYLTEGCMSDECVNRNKKSLAQVQLRGNVLEPFEGVNMETNIFGHTYSAPFGVAPVGLQGLMWPKTPEYLARAAFEKNIPFVLSTVSSASLENIAHISEGKAWFQLYNPSSREVQEDLIARVQSAGYPVLVVTVDVSTFGYRPRDIRNGLAMPPEMSVRNVFQMLSRPQWLIKTALAGKPEMKVLKRYMMHSDKNEQLMEFMNRAVMGPVDHENLKSIRDLWQGPLVIKGILTEEDVKLAVSLGADAVVVSNHGGRQLDAAESPIEPLQRLSKKYDKSIMFFMDSGIQNGVNIASALAAGARLAFMGRAFAFGVSALGERGAYHTINLFYQQLEQVMNQLRCDSAEKMTNHLVK